MKKRLTPWIWTALMKSCRLYLCFKNALSFGRQVKVYTLLHLPSKLISLTVWWPTKETDGVHAMKSVHNWPRAQYDSDLVDITVRYIHMAYQVLQSFYVLWVPLTNQIHTDCWSCTDILFHFMDIQYQFSIWTLELIISIEGNCHETYAFQIS